MSSYYGNLSRPLPHESCAPGVEQYAYTPEAFAAIGYEIAQGADGGAYVFSNQPCSPAQVVFSSADGLANVNALGGVPSSQHSQPRTFSTAPYAYERNTAPTASPPQVAWRYQAQAFVQHIRAPSSGASLTAPDYSRTPSSSSESSPSSFGGPATPSPGAFCNDFALLPSNGQFAIPNPASTTYLQNLFLLSSSAPIVPSDIPASTQFLHFRLPTVPHRVQQGASSFCSGPGSDAYFEGYSTHAEAFAGQFVEPQLAQQYWPPKHDAAQCSATGVPYNTDELQRSFVQNIQPPQSRRPDLSWSYPESRTQSMELRDERVVAADPRTFGSGQRVPQALPTNKSRTQAIDLGDEEPTGPSTGRYLPMPLQGPSDPSLVSRASGEGEGVKTKRQSKIRTQGTRATRARGPQPTKKENGRWGCAHPDCSKDFGCAADARRHFPEHHRQPEYLWTCTACKNNVLTMRKDNAQRHSRVCRQYGEIVRIRPDERQIARWWRSKRS